MHWISFILMWWSSWHGWRNIFQSGGAQVHVKKIRKCLCFLLATVTSQALKYDFITYTPYDGPNYTILDKITPLWKRIGESPEIQIGCYRDGSRSTASLKLIIRFILTEWNHSTLASLKFPLLSFWLALSLRCDVSYVTINDKFSW